MNTDAASQFETVAVLGAGVIGAGSGGICEFGSRYSDSFHRWWGTLGEVQIDQKTIEGLVKGIDDVAAGQNTGSLAYERDALILEFLKGRKQVLSSQ